MYSRTWPGPGIYATLRPCVSPQPTRPRPRRSPPSSPPSPDPAWCCPARSPNGAPAAAAATAPATPTRPACGPYWQWTRKIAAKTIGRWLTADQHRDYASWIDNDRRLHELLTRLEALG